MKENNLNNPDEVSVGYCKIPSYSLASDGVGELKIRRKTYNPLVVGSEIPHEGQDKARWSQKVDRHARLSNILIFNYINYRVDE